MQNSGIARRWAAGWWTTGHLGMGALLAVPYLVVLVVVLLGVALLPVALAGAPVLWVGLWLAERAGALERHRLAGSTGVVVPAAHRRPRRPGVGGWVRGLFDPVPWRAAAHLLLARLWGLPGAALVLALLATGLAAVTLPLYAWRVPDDGFLGWWHPGAGAGELVLLVALGVVALLAAPLLSAAWVWVELTLARALLGPTRGEVESALHARVDTLTSTRGAVVDSVQAERQRIERDLHDGPQQRLVSLSMNVGLARHRLEHDPAAADELLDEVQATAKQAMTEIRQVARGIHPPVLTDRGLDAALSALASQSPVPVQVRVDLPRRPAPTVEAIAYFCVSESLTNVAKHARAGQVLVDVSAPGPTLQVRVQDDGVGGARLDSPGTGLRGLQDRVRAVDGDLSLSSPPGGPTIVLIRLPLTVATEVPS